jgi:hypothetical protein
MLSDNPGFCVTGSINPNKIPTNGAINASEKNCENTYKTLNDRLKKIAILYDLR